MTTATMNFWLHRCHGTDENALVPQPVQRVLAENSGNIAQNFAASADVSENMLGVSCRLEEGSIVVLSADQSTTVPIASVFVAEVTVAQLPNGHWPDMAVVAVVPPEASKRGLKGTIIEGADNAGNLGWYIVLQGLIQAYDFVDKLSKAGCLRSDLVTSFSFPDGDDCIIGEGAYAKVFRMQGRDGSEVAIKQMNYTADYDSIEREIGALVQLQGDYVVGFRGIFWSMENEQVIFSAALDLAPHGDLLFKILQSGVMTETSAKPLFLGILHGLNRIHSCGIVHRDIKTENVLLSANETPMVADFGLACYITDEAQMTRRCGSAGFVAPEVCLGNPYDFKVDNFSAGVILYFILSKEMPFSSPDRDSAATMRKTVKCSLHLHRPPWDAMTSRLRNMFRQLICKNKDERLTASEALEHSWIVGKSDKSKTKDKTAISSSDPQPSLSLVSADSVLMGSQSIHSSALGRAAMRGEHSPAVAARAGSYLGQAGYTVSAPLPD
eukprot:TRINITY_DN5987_c1_g1_i1.p1 TRINITY_DN5987_c1_g1~~TRINITY_DN5987_c1_g1_i1.p1  ORF type:complete len:505 (+),score=69.34 TRINITY_DN5987_c1_g1_i1:25-1515(+)